MKSPITGIEVDYVATVGYTDPITGKMVDYKFSYEPFKKDKFTPKDCYEVTRLFRLCMILNKGEDFYQGILKNEVYVDINGRCICEWWVNLHAWHDRISKKGRPASYYKVDPDEEAREALSNFKDTPDDSYRLYNGYVRESDYEDW